MAILGRGKKKKKKSFGYFLDFNSLSIAQVKGHLTTMQEKGRRKSMKHKETPSTKTSMLLAE